MSNKKNVFVMAPKAVVIDAAMVEMVSKEVAKYKGKILDWASSKLRTGLCSIVTGKGKKDGCASLVRALVNDPDIGHECRVFCRYFGMTFTKENGQFIPKEFKTEHTTASALRDAFKVADGIKVPEPEKKATTETVKKVVEIKSNAEGLETLKKQMKSSIEAITKKATASNNRVMAEYFAYCLDEIFTQKHLDSFMAKKAASKPRNRIKAQ